MAEFFAELKRRHIYRVGAAYVVVAWAITQVIDVLSQVFDLASWIAQSAIVLLAIGFPVALLVAWTIESKPHQAVASAVRSKPTIVDWTLCGALAVVADFHGLPATRTLGHDHAASGRGRSEGCSRIDRHSRFHRSASLREPVQRSGTGVLLRRHDRGDHVRACQGIEFAGGRAHVGLPVQRREQGSARHRTSALRDAPHRRLGAQGRQRSPHHRAAYPGGRRHASVDGKL